VPDRDLVQLLGRLPVPWRSPVLRYLHADSSHE
jgi:hypothetical protein